MTDSAASILLGLSLEQLHVAPASRRRRRSRPGESAFDALPSVLGSKLAGLKPRVDVTCHPREDELHVQSRLGGRLDEAQTVEVGELLGLGIGHLSCGHRRRR